MDVFYNMPVPLKYPAVAYYWLFAILMNVLMMNFVLAIVVDSFVGIRANIGASPSAVAEVASFGAFRAASLLEQRGNRFAGSERVVARRVAHLARSVAVAQATSRRKGSAGESFATSSSREGSARGGAANLFATLVGMARSKEKDPNFWSKTDFVHYLPVPGVGGAEIHLEEMDVCQALAGPGCSQEDAEALAAMLVSALGHSKLVDADGNDVVRHGDDDLAATQSLLGAAGGNHRASEVMLSGQNAVVASLARLERNVALLGERLGRIDRSSTKPNALNVSFIGEGTGPP